MFNGLLKVPMQFVILFIGVLVFVFYLFYQPPVFHNQVLKQRAAASDESGTILRLESSYDSLYALKQLSVNDLVRSIQEDDESGIEKSKASVLDLHSKEMELREQVRTSISEAIPGAKTQDRDYMFLNFVLDNLPHGVVGLLLAVMFSAAMGSMAGELNALSSTTTVDVYKRSVRKEADPLHFLKASRWFTVMWAGLAILFATLANFAENLIQFVNIIGSLFYGTILGIFLTAFYVKRVKGTAVFWAAIVAEMVVLYCYFFTEVAFLLYNIIGCAVVVVISFIIQLSLPKQLAE
jgi:Na+(H+)/acetate symporter ActP